MDLDSTETGDVVFVSLPDTEDRHGVRSESVSSIFHSTLPPHTFSGRQSDREPWSPPAGPNYPTRYTRCNCPRLELIPRLTNY